MQQPTVRQQTGRAPAPARAAYWQFAFPG